MSIDEQPISRRAVARTAGWSVPVVAVALAAPQAAASPSTCSCLKFGGGTWTRTGSYFQWTLYLTADNCTVPAIPTTALFATSAGNISSSISISPLSIESPYLLRARTTDTRVVSAATVSSAVIEIQGCSSVLTSTFAPGGGVSVTFA